MKPILKVLLFVVATAGSTSTVVAGQLLRSYSDVISGAGGHLEYYEARNTCVEYPDGSGGKIVFGQLEVYYSVEGGSDYDDYQFESYEGLDNCPDSFNGVSGGAVQSLAISGFGFVFAADCTGQAVSSASGTGHVRYPGKGRPQNYTNNYKEHYTLDPYSMSCAVTVTDPGGATHTADSYGYASAFRAFGNIGK